MQPAMIEVRSLSLFGMMGSGPSTLQFVGDATEVDLLLPGERKNALVCPECSATVISNDQWLP